MVKYKFESTDKSEIPLTCAWVGKENETIKMTNLNNTSIYRISHIIVEVQIVKYISENLLYLKIYT